MSDEEVCDIQVDLENNNFTLLLSRIVIYFTPFYVLISLVVFLWRRRTSVFLRKRSFAAVLLNGAAQLTLVFVLLPISRLEEDRKDAQDYCLLWNISTFAALPLMCSSLLATTLSFKHKAQLSRSLADHSEKTSRMDWFLASKEFSFVFLFGTLLTILGGSFFISLFLCPSAVSDQCILIGRPGDLVYNLLIGFLTTLTVLRIYRDFRTYPDPFGILYELGSVSVMSFSIALIVVTVQLVMKLLFNPDFDILVFFYLIPLFIFFCICNLPLLKARNFDVKAALDAENDLDKVMTDPTGHSLLKEHLVNEFSVENLLFIDDVKEFKLEEDTEKRNYLGRNIYIKYLQNRYMNLSAITYTQLQVAQNAEFEFENDFYNSALKEIRQLLCFDSFSRFIKTAKFKHYAGLEAAAPKDV